MEKLTEQQVILLNENLPLIEEILNNANISQDSDNFEDLFQEGSIGLLRAVRGWQSEKEGWMSFQTYARYCILNSFRGILNKNEENEKTLNISEFKNLIGQQDVQYEDFSTFFARLTDRECSILKYLLEGYSIREIGRKLGISAQFTHHLQKKIRVKWVKEFGPYNGCIVKANNLFKDGKFV